jgi:cytochrome c peroxidase
MNRLTSWRTCGAWVAALVGSALVPQLVSTQGTTQGSTQTTTSGATTGVIITDQGQVIRFSSRAPRKLADIPITVPADNPHTDEKAALGRRLFFDKVLSSDRSVSCATCHDPERAFTDARTLAVGVFGRVGKRHSPALINRGFGRSHFWDGRVASLEAQVLQPIVDPNEMDLPLETAVERLAADESYRDAFLKAFARPVSKDDLGRALATYLRTIRSGDSPYDRFIAGDTSALSAEQQRGLNVFRSRGRCVICHGEPTFTDELFQNTGVAWRIEPGATTGAFQDDGRFQVTGQDRDRGKFKTPTLREIARTAPYMHDGSLATLADVIDFYDGGGRPNRNLFPVLRPLGLSAEEKQALIKFLESLSGVVTGK